MYQGKMPHTDPRKETDMITYVCLAILILFVAVKSAIYMKHRKHTPSSDELDLKLLSLINQKSDRHD